MRSVNGDVMMCPVCRTDVTNRPLLIIRNEIIGEQACCTDCWLQFMENEKKRLKRIGEEK